MFTERIVSTDENFIIDQVRLLFNLSCNFVSGIEDHDSNLSLGGSRFSSRSVAQ